MSTDKPTGVWKTTKIPDERTAADVMGGFLGDSPPPEVVKKFVGLTSKDQFQAALNEL